MSVLAHPATQEKTLAERISDLNKAINLMGRRGNCVRFDNYSPAQLFALQKHFPNTEVRVQPLGSGRRFYLILEVEHVMLFSTTFEE